MCSLGTIKAFLVEKQFARNKEEGEENEAEETEEITSHGTLILSHGTVILSDHTDHEEISLVQYINPVASDSQDDK